VFGGKSHFAEPFDVIPAKAGICPQRTGTNASLQLSLE
jgi:hypothetical protein